MQGISIYSRPGRPTWYAAYDCPKRLRRVNVSTGHRTDDPQGKRLAYQFARERSASGLVHGTAGDKAEWWDNWAEPWLRDRFRHSPKTLTNYLGAWKHLSFFLRDRAITVPRLLTYQHAVDFVHWRESQVKKRSGRKVSRNTALHNTKVLSRLMREAVRRGWASGNPVERLGQDVSADPPPKRPEFTDEDIALVRAELRRRQGKGRPSDWMPIAFEIALLQGCRLGACEIPMGNVDLERGTITLREKGARGKPTVFTMPIHPELRPLLAKLKAEGRTNTCKITPFASRNFSRVLRALGLKHHTFHSTRVTVISRMARAGVPIQQAMAYVHHGSMAVHQIYQRLRPEDAGAAHAAIVYSQPAAAPSSERASASPRTRDDHPAIAPRGPGKNSGLKK